VRDVRWQLLRVRINPAVDRNGLAVIGEIGLSGGAPRAVNGAGQTHHGSGGLGFKRILTPKAGGKITPLAPGYGNNGRFGQPTGSVEKGWGCSFLSPALMDIWRSVSFTSGRSVRCGYSILIEVIHQGLRR